MNSVPSFDKDHFSKQSAEYAQYRPGYPNELFAYLASITPEHELAVDCATGNGQAAVGLARHFERVIAIDRSAEQLAHAPHHPKITYRLGSAEAIGLPTRSVDLVATAQALHWFALDPFYDEVRRVLKPGGVFAAWTYYLNTITPAIDAIIRHYHDEILRTYWPPERKFLTDGYRSLPFPFRELTPPRIEMVSEWTLDHLIGYLRSWSATQRYIDQNNANPLDLITQKLSDAWGSPTEMRRISWPLTLRIGSAGERL